MFPCWKNILLAKYHFFPMTSLREQRENKNENSEPDELPRYLSVILKCINCLPSVILMTQNSIQKSSLWRWSYFPHSKGSCSLYYTYELHCHFFLSAQLSLWFLKQGCVPFQIRTFQEEIWIPYDCHSFLLLSALNPLHLQCLISWLESV